MPDIFSLADITLADVKNAEEREEMHKRKRVNESNQPSQRKPEATVLAQYPSTVQIKAISWPSHHLLESTEKDWTYLRRPMRNRLFEQSEPEKQISHD